MLHLIRMKYSKGQQNSMGVKALALHSTNTDAIPSTAYACRVPRALAGPQTEPKTIIKYSWLIK